jgi:hypothetical protein
MKQVIVITGAGSRADRMGVEQQYAWRDAAVPLALLCCEGRDGLTRRQLRERTHPLGYRNQHRGAGCIHERDQPLRTCRCAVRRAFRQAAVSRAR